MKLHKKSILIIILYLSNIKCVDEFIIYAPSQMDEHRDICKEKMITNPANLSDPTYQMQRAMRTISGTDSDYIPKIVGAGEIFKDGDVAYQLMHNGIKVHLNSYYGKWTNDVIWGLKGHHEPQEEKCFYEVLKYIPENATMIELGSFWAYYSLWFAFSIKGAKNYLIEPDLKRLEVGKKNFALNNKFGVFKRGYIGNVVDRDPDISGAESIILDDFIEKEGIDHINILHADIQGSEFDMLKTLKKHLIKIDYFFISTHGFGPIHASCRKFLIENNYIILAEHSEQESCSGDGLIVAKKKAVYGPKCISIQKY